LNATSKAVFISYASQDAEAAGRICEALRAAGIEVWFDQSELRGGDAWDQSIRKQIKTCALFLPLISRSTHDRVEGYFRLEWKLAVDRSHLIAADQAFLLPVVIDDTRDDEERVPERFREVQWTRLPSGVTPAAFVERVRRLLSGEPAQGPTGTPSVAARVSAAPTTGTPVVASWRSKAALLVAVAAVVVALAYFVANRLVLPKRSAEVGAAAVPGAQSAPATAFNPPPHSVAVLPFTNLSGDPKQEYFSDGISEELINALSHIGALDVAARTSSFSFKGQQADIGTIARKLNVGAVLEGSVRRSGNTIRITAQLINAVNGFHMWSEDYDRDLKDVLALQTDIAEAVAEQLKVKLLEAEAAKIDVGGTKNAEAYVAFLRGTQIYATADTHVEYHAALAAFDEAIALDPLYAAAYAERAYVLSDLVDKPSLAAGFREEALKSANRAIALAPDLAESHLALYKVRVRLNDFQGAAEEIRHAQALAPGSARVLQSAAIMEQVSGHTDASVAQAQRVVRLDPESYGARYILVMTLYYARRFDEAVIAAREAQALKPDTPWVAWVLFHRYLALGQPELARQTCEPAGVLPEGERHFCLAMAYGALHQSAQAERELESFKAAGEDSPYDYAKIYLQWGDTAAALTWLETAERELDGDLESLKVDPLLDPIRNTPRFKALEMRLNFPP
jgi:TolB-like protein